MLLFSFPCLVERWIDRVNFLLRFTLNLTPMLIFVLFFIWRLIWDVLNHLGRSQMDCMLPLSFWVTVGNRLVCAKTIPSWVKKVLCVGKAHMSQCFLGGGAAASAALVVGVSLVSILQAVDLARVFTLARHYFFYLHYYYGLAPAGPQWVGALLVNAKHQVLCMMGCQAIALLATEQIVSQLSLQY